MPSTVATGLRYAAYFGTTIKDAMPKFNVGDMVKYTGGETCKCEMCQRAAEDEYIGYIAAVREDDYGIEYDLKFPSGAFVEWIVEAQLELFIVEFTMDDLTISYELD